MTASASRAEKVPNPFWESVRDEATTSPWAQYVPAGRRSGHLVVEWGLKLNRDAFTNLYSWTITDPKSLAFIGRHSRGKLVDPFAGTGYWAALLQKLDVEVHCSDIDPPRPGANTNIWHSDTSVWTSVFQRDAAEAVAASAPSFTLLLSWPPHSDAACRALKAYQGDRVIFMGELNPDMGADDAFFVELAHGWVQVDAHTPVRWAGLKDVIVVFERCIREGTEV